VHVASHGSPVSLPLLVASLPLLLQPLDPHPESLLAPVEVSATGSMPVDEPSSGTQAPATLASARAE
jgi:hypothetical protein